MSETVSICPDCGKAHNSVDAFPEFYSELCDAVFCAFHPEWGDDGLMHTSPEARTAANYIMLILKGWGLNPFDTEVDEVVDPVPHVDGYKEAN